MNLDLTHAVWRKSLRSGHDGGECVEIAALACRIAVRDSKQPDRGALTFGRTNWSAFVTALKKQPQRRPGSLDLDVQLLLREIAEPP